MKAGQGQAGTAKGGVAKGAAATIILLAAAYGAYVWFAPGAVPSDPVLSGSVANKLAPSAAAPEGAASGWDSALSGGEVPEVAVAPETAAPETGTPVPDAPAANAPVTTAPSSEKPATTAVVPPPVPPTFDVVRIEPDGAALIAGRAGAGSLVSVLLDGSLISSATADRKGGFVAMFTLDPSDAPRLLTLRMVLADGREIMSDQQVILAVGDVAPPAAPMPPAAPVPSGTPDVVAGSGGNGATDADSVDAAAAQAEIPLVMGTMPVRQRTEAEARADGGALATAAPDSGPKMDQAAAGQAGQTRPTQSQTVAPAAPPAMPGPVVAVVTAEADLGAKEAISTDVSVQNGASSSDTIASPSPEPKAAVQADLSATTTLATGPDASASEAAVANVAALAKNTLNMAPQTESAPELSAPANPTSEQIAAPAEPASAPPPAPQSRPAPVAILTGPQGVKVLQPGGIAKTSLLVPVSIDAISYTASGDVKLAGRGLAGDVIRIYLNNAALVDYRVGPDGGWGGVLPAVAPGLYKLRADQIDADGKVTARFETPFLRETLEALAAVLNPAKASDTSPTPEGTAAPVGAAAPEAVTAPEPDAPAGKDAAEDQATRDVVAEPQPAAGVAVDVAGPQTIEEMASPKTDAPPEATAQSLPEAVPKAVAPIDETPSPAVQGIAAKNPQHQPDLVAVPARKVPRAPSLQPAKGVAANRAATTGENLTVTQRTASAAAPLPEQAARPDTALPATVTVTVQPGFTLWGIARERFGEGILYVQVFKANKDRIRNPDLIYPGQVFTLPLK